MNYLPEVVKAKHVSGFIIATRFNNGTEKHVDISQWFKGPVFKALKDPKFFEKFFIEGGTLAWPNGVDIASESLYEAADIRLDNKRKIKGRSRQPVRPHTK
jgi:hypothetical protein